MPQLSESHHYSMASDHLNKGDCHRDERVATNNRALLVDDYIMVKE